MIHLTPERFDIFVCASTTLGPECGILRVVQNLLEALRNVLDHSALCRLLGRGFRRLLCRETEEESSTAECQRFEQEQIGHRPRHVACEAPVISELKLSNCRTKTTPDGEKAILPGCLPCSCFACEK